MSDPFLIFLTIAISILTVILAVAGIQVILILRNLNRTLSRINTALDATQILLYNLQNPLSDLKSLGDGVKTGMHVAQHVVTWVKHHRQSEPEAV